MDVSISADSIAQNAPLRRATNTVIPPKLAPESRAVMPMCHSLSPTGVGYYERKFRWYFGNLDGGRYEKTTRRFARLVWRCCQAPHSRRICRLPRQSTRRRPLSRRSIAGPAATFNGGGGYGMWNQDTQRRELLPGSCRFTGRDTIRRARLVWPSRRRLRLSSPDRRHVRQHIVSACSATTASWISDGSMQDSVTGFMAVRRAKLSLGRRRPHWLWPLRRILLAYTNGGCDPVAHFNQVNLQSLEHRCADRLPHPSAYL